MAEKLIYKAPPSPAPEETVRRVYVLPISLVKRIHKYGYDSGFQSEVAAVRKLLEEGLRSVEDSY